MSQTRTFELSGGYLRGIFSPCSFIRIKAARSGIAYEADLLNRNTLRITLTGNVDALDDLVWTLRDEFGERIREVRG